VINYPALVDGSFFLLLKHKTIIQTADAIKKGPKKPSKLRKTIKIILLCRQRREDEEEVSWMKSFSAAEKKTFRLRIRASAKLFSLLFIYFISMN
jgi:hypothetical protein